jgi:hypothetical protein
MRLKIRVRAKMEDPERDSRVHLPWSHSLKSLKRSVGNDWNSFREHNQMVVLQPCGGVFS